MAIAVYFHRESMGTSQYDQIMKKLDAAGAAKPVGRLHHSCFGQAEKLMVYDVWESQETFDAFGKKLVPILGQVGVDPRTPDIRPVHNLVD